MYVGQLTITQQHPVERDAASDAINRLLSALRMNGQINGREFPIAATPTGYRATVLLPEKSALNETHHNRYVRQGLQHLQAAGLAEPVCQFAEDIDGADACVCKHPSSYVLYTTYVSLESPLRCGDCFHPVPLYRIPPTKDAEYYDVLSWQSYYQACDTLQMNCTPMEQTALRQLSRYDSGLTRDGLSICQRIKAATHRPVFYYLHRYKVRGGPQERKRLCPSCQGEWLLPAPWHGFDFKCDRCDLISNLAGSGG